MHSILNKYFSSLSIIDEDELLGLAHCLHNIGALYDIKKEYTRSLPHYEEALAIKNAIAGIRSTDSMPLFDQGNPEKNEVFVHKLLQEEDHELPLINKATLSASVTRQKIAAVCVKQKKYDYALFHFSHALRTQRKILGIDSFRVGSILTSIGNVLLQTSTHSEMAVMCYKESLRISQLHFGHNHVTVALALFNIGGLHESNKRFNKAMQYYQRALSVYKQKYSQELRQRLCSGLNSPKTLIIGGEGCSIILSTGDEIIVGGGASALGQTLRDQYSRVTSALKSAKKQDILNQGKRPNCIGDSNDAWLTFEVFLFNFVEILSGYFVFPAQTAVRETIDNSCRRIEAAVNQAFNDLSGALGCQFQLQTL